MGCSGSKVTVATYNLYWWYKTIANNAPFDLAGFQECDNVQQVLGGSGIRSFDFYAPQGSDAPLAWNATRFQKIGGPGSEHIAEDKYGARLMNWVRLHDGDTNASIFFANTHGPLNQCAGEAGAKAAANYQAAVNKHKQQGDAVVFTGDFNCGSMEETMMILGQGLTNAATDQSFNGADHVLIDQSVQLCGSSSTQGFPSDHEFLKMELTLKTGAHDPASSPALLQPPPPVAPVASTALATPALPATPAAPAAPAPVLAAPDRHSASNCPPPGKNPCCTTCPTSYFCPSNQGCYAEWQTGCPGDLCPSETPILL
ncbi:unnamed protein product [Symbiodinium pilosum]|uniref:Endonuclease/exonuclease/phosphatase domain-containing protein n=1 Tax=Symbiodinium pilosum TaxID=2952 RepID=A0A812TIK8_SYMPI|nr:unnamed protein product [Symbiodinium pilosum]